MAVPLPDARVAQESVRRANGRFRSTAVSYGLGDAMLPFLCECADISCLGRIEMTGSDYRDVHAVPRNYVVIRDHPIADGEHVVDDRDAYLVMAKPAF